MEEQGQTEEAEEMYAKLLQGNAEWDDAWFRLGLPAADAGRHPAPSKPSNPA